MALPMNRTLFPGVPLGFFTGLDEQRVRFGPMHAGAWLDSVGAVSDLEGAVDLQQPLLQRRGGLLRGLHQTLGERPRRWQ